MNDTAEGVGVITESGGRVPPTPETPDDILAHVRAAIRAVGRPVGQTTPTDTEAYAEGFVADRLREGVPWGVLWYLSPEPRTGSESTQPLAELIDALGERDPWIGGNPPPILFYHMEATPRSMSVAVFPLMPFVDVPTWETQAYNELALQEKTSLAERLRTANTSLRRARSAMVTILGRLGIESVTAGQVQAEPANETGYVMCNVVADGRRFRGRYVPGDPGQIDRLWLIRPCAVMGEQNMVESQISPISPVSLAGLMLTPPLSSEGERRRNEGLAPDAPAEDDGLGATIVVMRGTQEHQWLKVGRWYTNRMALGVDITPGAEWTRHEDAFRLTRG